MDYDYKEAVREDVREYIENEIDLDDFPSKEKLCDYLDDVLFCCDSVTGNGSGSYTFNTWQAEEYVSHNLDLLGEALSEFGDTDFSILEKGAEAADVTIRCYLLYQAIRDVVDEIWEGGED